MNKTIKFNVGDKVKYTSPCEDGRPDFGVVIDINPEHFTVANGEYRTGYLIRWVSSNEDWIADGNLALDDTEGNLSISEAKEAKVALESEILRLIQDFNEKTNLQIKDIDLNCYRIIGGECFYQVNVKVEI